MASEPFSSSPEAPLPEGQTNSFPTESEIASALNISPSAYEKLLEKRRHVTFLGRAATHSTDKGHEPIEREPAPGDSGEETLETGSHRERVDLIFHHIQSMPDMHRKVLALYYFEDLRLREIAELCGMCESRVCQIHAQAILSIRAHLETDDPHHASPEQTNVKPRLTA